MMGAGVVMMGAVVVVMGCCVVLMGRAYACSFRVRDGLVVFGIVLNKNLIQKLFSTFTWSNNPLFTKNHLVWSYRIMSRISQFALV